MTEATVIVDHLITLLSRIPGVYVSDMPPDEHSKLPVLHVRELDESYERTGVNLRCLRSVQIDMYLAADASRRSRDDLLLSVVSALLPLPTGIQLPGTALSALKLGQAVLEPEEVGSSIRLIQLPVSMSYIESRKTTTR